MTREQAVLQAIAAEMETLPFVICFTRHDTDIYRWEDLMRRAAFDLYRAQQ